MLEKSKNNEEFTKYSSKKVISSKKKEVILSIKEDNIWFGIRFYCVKLIDCFICYWLVSIDEDIKEIIKMKQEKPNEVNDELLR